MRMLGLFRNLLLIVFVGTHAQAGRLDKLSSAQRDRLIRCSWALDKITHIDHDTHRFRLTTIKPEVLSASAGKIDELELEAAFHLRDFLSVPILLAPDIGKHKSTPGFDGVLYDHYGYARSNLSIKSIDVQKLTHGIITQTLRSARASARSQLMRVYDLENFLEQSGFVISDDGVILPRKGLPYQIAAASRMQYFINLFGLNQTSPRKTSVLINVFNSDKRPGAFQPHFELRKHKHGKWRHGLSDQYLFITNMNGTQNGFGANLSHLAENLDEDSRISEYIFMSPTQILVIRPDQIILKEKMLDLH